MAKHRVEQRYENKTTRESIVIEGTLEHHEGNIEVIRRMIVDGEITPDDVEWDVDPLIESYHSSPHKLQLVSSSFNVIVYG